MRRKLFLRNRERNDKKKQRENEHLQIKKMGGIDENGELRIGRKGRKDGRGGAVILNITEKSDIGKKQ